MTQTREDYLRALYVLHEEKGILRSVDIAGYLSVSKASVSEMIRLLRDGGLVEFRSYSKLRLTQKGMRVARELTSRHRIIELFLRKNLKISPSKIHGEANRLEHAFSRESIKKLKRMLGNPKTDPHGKPIP